MYLWMECFKFHYVTEIACLHASLIHTCSPYMHATPTTMHTVFACMQSLPECIAAFTVLTRMHAAFAILARVHTVLAAAFAILARIHAVHCCLCQNTCSLCCMQPLLWNMHGAICMHAQFRKLSHFEVKSKYISFIY